MKIIAALAVAAGIAIGLVAPAHGAQFAPVPEVTLYEGTHVKQAPEPESGVTLNRRGAATLTIDHEHRFWHSLPTPLRFGTCVRRSRRLFQCSVQAHLAIIVGERAAWHGYVDVVHLGLDDRAWISTIFPKPLTLTLAPGMLGHHKRKPHKHAHSSACAIEDVPAGFDEAAWQRETYEAEHETPEEQAAVQAELAAERAEAHESEAEEEAGQREVEAQIAAGC